VTLQALIEFSSDFPEGKLKIFGRHEAGTTHIFVTYSAGTRKGTIPSVCT
jgi:hypothetical protein